MAVSLVEAKVGPAQCDLNTINYEGVIPGDTTLSSAELCDPAKLDSKKGGIK
jgi:hypothetical protein